MLRKIVIVGLIALFLSGMAAPIQAITAPDPEAHLRSGGKTPEQIERMKKKRRPWREPRTPPGKEPEPFILPPTEARLKAAERLEEKYPTPPGERDRVIIRWNEWTGLPSEISIYTPPPEPIDKPAEEIAREFLNEWRDLMGIDPADLGPPKVEIDGGYTSLEYPQINRGISVLWGGVRIRVEEGGRVASIDSHYYPNLGALQIPSTPNYSAQAALDIVAKFEEVERERISLSETSLWVVPRCDGVSPCNFYLAWRVQIITPLIYNGYYVDAIGGHIIGEFPTVLH